MNVLRIPIHTHPFTTATYSVMERAAIDTIGPLPADDEGYTYLIVFITNQKQMEFSIPSSTKNNKF